MLTTSAFLGFFRDKSGKISHFFFFIDGYYIWTLNISPAKQFNRLMNWIDPMNWIEPIKQCGGFLQKIIILDTNDWFCEVRGQKSCSFSIIWSTIVIYNVNHQIEWIPRKQFIDVLNGWFGQIGMMDRWLGNNKREKLYPNFGTYIKKLSLSNTITFESNKSKSYNDYDNDNDDGTFKKIGFHFLLHLTIHGHFLFWTIFPFSIKKTTTTFLIDTKWKCSWTRLRGQ